ncbi:MAG: cache domain-containing protein [bacterium]
MRKNLAAIALTAGAFLAVLFFVFHQHQTSKEKVLSQFNMNQLLTTQQFARPMERYFRSRSQDLRWLAYIASQQAFDRDKVTAAIQSNLNRLKATNVQEVALLNEKGTVVYSTTAGAKGKNHSQADFFSWARKPGNSEAVRMWYETMDGLRTSVATGNPEPPHIGIFLATPLYRESVAGGRQKPGGKFAGVLMFTIDLEKMLAERSPLQDPATKLHKSWIMERGGTLLVHSGLGGWASGPTRL